MSEFDTYNLIKKIGICNSVKTKDINAHAYFMKLFKTKYIPDDENPNKLEGLIDFKIIKQKITQTLFERGEIFENNVKLEMGIIKEDGTEDSISWLSCYHEPSSHREKLISACILSIHNHPITLKRGKTSFNFIDEFLTKTSVITIIPAHFDKNEFNQYIFRKEDSKFRDKWIRYYNRRNKKARKCKKCKSSNPNVPDEEGWVIV